MCHFCVVYVSFVHVGTIAGILLDSCQNLAVHYSRFSIWVFIVISYRNKLQLGRSTSLWRLNSDAHAITALVNMPSSASSIRVISRWRIIQHLLRAAAVSEAIMRLSRGCVWDNDETWPQIRFPVRCRRYRARHVNWTRSPSVLWNSQR